MINDAVFEHRFIVARDGLKLHLRDYAGAGSGGLPIVCLPGLSRNARDFDPLARWLSSSDGLGRRVVALDYRGRGASDYDSDWKNYNVAVEAQDVIDVLESLGIARAAFIGTSRGGLIVHLLAAMALPLIGAVVLNDIGPVLGIDGLAQIKRYLSNRSEITTIADAIAVQRSIHGAAFSALSDADFERMTRAIMSESEPVRADHDPNLLRTLDLIDLDKPLPDLWPQFELLKDVPILVVRGANSTLLTADMVTEMQRRHSGLQAITVDGQGHPPLLETGELPRLIADFLRTKS